jgi:hypothetical protein
MAVNILDLKAKPGDLAVLVGGERNLEFGLRILDR